MPRSIRWPTHRRVIHRLRPDNTRAGALLALALGLSTNVASIPIRGMPVPELSDIDDEVIAVMTAENIEGCTVGVMHEGCLVYLRGFGYRNELGDPMPENATMRVASISKCFIKRAIDQLVEDGALALGEHAFDLGQPGGGVLALAPFGGISDVRVCDITVQHLLDHTAAWADEYTFREIEIADAMGIDSPPGLENTIRYALGKDLIDDPGAEDRYSNFGYNVLGRIVEERGGMPYFEYLRSRVLTKGMWVPSTEFFIAEPFWETGLREPHYFIDPAESLVRNVYNSDGARVEWPYGGFDTFAAVGSTSIVASAAPLLTFLHEHYAATGHGFIGWMGGSSGYLRGNATDVGIVVLMNDRKLDGGTTGYASAEIGGRIWDILDTVIWPTTCIDGLWVSDVIGLGVGSYDDPFGGMLWTLVNVTEGTKLLFHPGSHDWSGDLDRKLILDAPLGPVVIGGM